MIYSGWIIDYNGRKIIGYEHVVVQNIKEAFVCCIDASSGTALTKANQAGERHVIRLIAQGHERSNHIDDQNRRD